MNTKDPKAELQHLIDELDKEATRAVANIEYAAKKAMLDAENFVAALDFERALPVGQSAEIAAILKADHTLVGVIQSDWPSHEPEEIYLRWANRNNTDLGKVKLPKGTHRAILFIFEEKAS